MKSLFINTSTKKLIIAIVVDNNIKYQYCDDTNTDLSANIMPIIDEAFNTSNLKPQDIDTIFVTNGPGSFTGIRIGLTIAKVMAWSLNIKVIPVSSLELMASGTNNEYIIPMIDARRGYVFAALYDNELNALISDKYDLYDNFINECANKSYIVDGNIVSHEMDFEKPKYDIVKVINKHMNDDGINPHELNPNYLKMTEAEEKLNRE